jgi:hypothetical protein
MNWYSNLYEKLYGNPPIAEFAINTDRLFELLTGEDITYNPLYSEIKGVLVYDGNLKLLTFVNCKSMKSNVVPVFNPITGNVVAFVSKMFNRVFRLPKGKDVKVVIKKDVIQFKMPGDESYSLIDVDGYVILK